MSTMSLRLADQVKHSFADWLHHSHSHNELTALSDRALEDIGNPGGRRVMKPQSPFGWPDWLGGETLRLTRGAFVLQLPEPGSVGAPWRALRFAWHFQPSKSRGNSQRRKEGWIGKRTRKSAFLFETKGRVAYCSMIGQCRFWGWTQFSCSNAGSR